jgi:hypothetical protein
VPLIQKKTTHRMDFLFRQMKDAFFSKTSRLREHHLTLVSKATSGLKKGGGSKDPNKKR